MMVRDDLVSVAVGAEHPARRGPDRATGFHLGEILELVHQHLHIYPDQPRRQY